MTSRRSEALHGDDFCLKAPNGETFTKDEYLEAVGSGRLDYVLWEPISPVEVTIDGDEGGSGYRSRIGCRGRRRDHRADAQRHRMSCVTVNG